MGKISLRFCWQVDQFCYFEPNGKGYSVIPRSAHSIYLNQNEYKFLFDYKEQLDINSILINSKTYVDQIEVDTLKEFANCPQANAFRRVVFSILCDLPQHHLFQSYLRSRGFDVSISKEKFCHEGFNGTP